MTPEEKREILELFETGEKRFLGALTGIADADAARKPSPGCWSVLECAEHVAVVEERLLAYVENARPADGTVIPVEREARIRERAQDRSFRVAAPDVAIPTGRYATLADAAAQFVTNRLRSIVFVQSCDDDLRAKLAEHPILKTANCYEMLLMMAYHPVRHAKQIEEIKSAISAAGEATTAG